MQKITANGIDLTSIIQEAQEKAELPENQLIGAAISRQLDLKILLYEATAEQTEAVKAGVFKYNGNTYQVYSQPKRYDDTISITAYDKMAAAAKKYRSPGVTGEYTAAEIWDDIASKMGVSANSSDLGSAGSIVCKGKAKLGAHTMRDFLAWIAEAAGGNAIITNDALTIKSIAKTASLTAEDATELTEANHIVIENVRKWQGDDLLTAGTGTTALYLSTGNPLITQAEVTAIYGEYGGLEIYECSALKTWCSQTAGLDIGDLMAYNGKNYIITGYTRSHHGNSAEDSLELTGSTATNATKGEVTSKTKEQREAGLDGSTYMPDQTNTGTGGTGTGSIIASELRTNPNSNEEFIHIKDFETEIKIDGERRITISEGDYAQDTVEDTQEGVDCRRILIALEGGVGIRIVDAADSDTTLLLFGERGYGDMYLNGNLNLLQRGSGYPLYKNTLTVDRIVCRSLTLQNDGFGIPEFNAGLSGSDVGVSGRLEIPGGCFYITNGLITGGRFTSGSFTPYYGHEDDDEDDEHPFVFDHEE